MKKLMLFGMGSILIVTIIITAILMIQSQSAEPSQPIAFSHRIHAGEYKIPCLYCHSYARMSTVAGIPSVQRCMGCHKITSVDKPEVKKIHGYWNRKESIQWSRIYKLPDFVYFSHRPHINREIACQNCHGSVETMERVVKESSLKMGWCLDCHKKNKANIDCLVCHK